MIEIAKEINDLHGSVDILVNNAGVSLLGLFKRYSSEDIDWILDVNIRGVMYGCHAFLPYLLNSNNGHIVNISSLAGDVPLPSTSVYVASKHAIRGFSLSLRMELKTDRIGVTAILPGMYKSNLIKNGRNYDEPGAEVIDESIKFQQNAKSAEHVANLVLKGIVKNSAEIRWGLDSFFLRWIYRLSPSLLHRLMLYNISRIAKKKK